ncbi:hypothetical protein BJV82DRAFT_515296 [Fennellomyces sp. T-0311]|nr:hypothetical protein BJV82DRAFT_515296 [Fennellomyces sp. T-0311]
MEQYSFCRLHRVELVIKPKGKDDGYPLNIDFDKIKGRVHQLKRELRAVIDRKVESEFRDIALKSYEEDGANKARSAMAVMSRFDKTLPGYYGSKGAATILETLNVIFLHSGELTAKHTAPQLPLEYIQQVLVPEAGLRLIRQDIAKWPENRNLSEAQLISEASKVMNDSREFGCLVYPASNEDLGEFTEENFIDLTSSDDEDDDSDDLE